MDDDKPPVQSKGRGQGKAEGMDGEKVVHHSQHQERLNKKQYPKKIPKKEDSKQKQKGVRCTRSTVEEETESEKEARMNLSKRCKEKVNKLRGKNTEDKNKSTSHEASEMEGKGDSTSPLDYLKTEEFKQIAVNIRQSVKLQLEKEGVLNNISNGNLRDRICKKLIYVTGFEEVSKDHIDRVIFMSHPDQSTTDTKTNAVKKGPIGNGKKQETDSDGSTDEWDKKET